MMISICCVTYNHKEYVSKAIEGILLQQTSCQKEIIIYDDASTDGTAEIIREYENKFPNLIRGIYQTENQYSKGLLPYPNFAWPMAKGKYIALCEGDDYWTDPNKLQKQVDFLETNEDYIACSHESIIKYHPDFKQPDILCSKAKLPYSQNKKVLSDYSFEEVSRTVLFQSSTLVFRNVTDDLPKSIYNNPLWDVALFLTLGGKGKIHFLKDVMSVYRKHPRALTTFGNLWRDRTIFIQNMLIILNDVNIFFSKRYNRIINELSTEYLMELWAIYTKRGEHSKAKDCKILAKKNSFSCFHFQKQCFYRISELIEQKISDDYHKLRRYFRQSIKRVLISSNIYGFRSHQ